MVSVFKIALSLTLLLGTTLAYPYSDLENQDEERIYEDDPENIHYIPLRRVSRAVINRPVPRMRGREKYVVIPEGMQMHGGGGDQRFDLIPAPSNNNEPIAAETGYGHSSHPQDYVDYGAYTGGYGAFGWYSDHPVHTYGQSSYH